MLSVPADSDGVEIPRHRDDGRRDVNDVFFTDCGPGRQLVGGRRPGVAAADGGLNTERLVIAAQSTGIAQRSLDDVLAYVKERKQFGSPIGTFQALRHRLADLATEVACSRLIT